MKGTPITRQGALRLAKQPLLDAEAERTVFHGTIAEIHDVYPITYDQMGFCYTLACQIVKHEENIE